MRPDATGNNAVGRQPAGARRNIPKIQTADWLTPAGKLSTIRAKVSGPLRSRSGFQVQVPVQAPVPGPRLPILSAQIPAKRGANGSVFRQSLTPHRRMPDQEDGTGHGRVVLFFFHAPFICKPNPAGGAQAQSTGPEHRPSTLAQKLAQKRATPGDPARLPLLAARCIARSP
jgi:hypothetical protein